MRGSAVLFKQSNGYQEGYIAEHLLWPFGNLSVRTNQDENEEKSRSDSK